MTPLRSKKNKKKARGVRQFFLEEAEEGDDEEDEEDYEMIEGAHVDKELKAAELDAIARAERRHMKNRAFLEEDANAIAQQYENRYRGQFSSRVTADGDIDQYLTEDLQQQSLLPGINDPGIWCIKCTPALESVLVRSLLIKCLKSKETSAPFHINSAFTTSSKGYVYIEASNEKLVREAISGLNGLYFSTLKKISVESMTSLFNFTVKKVILKENQWVRIKRGPLKGDLAKILHVIEDGNKVIIKAIPRADFSMIDPTTNKPKKTTLSNRPTQKLFKSEDAIAKNHMVERRKIPYINEFCEVWNNDFYQHGYLVKIVNPSTFVSAVNVRPKLEEVGLFQEKLMKKMNRVRNQDNDEEESEEEEEEDDEANRNFLLELTKSIGRYNIYTY